GSTRAGAGGGGGGGGSSQRASDRPQPIKLPTRAPPPVDSPISQFFEPPESPCSAATPEMRPPAVAPKSAPEPIVRPLQAPGSIPAHPLSAMKVASATPAAASLSIDASILLAWLAVQRS